MKKVFLFGFLLLLCQWIGAAPITTSKYIVIDQFGYRTLAQKIAVIRDSEVGYDAAESFVPSTNYEVREWESDDLVFSADIVAWNNGTIDVSSGDKAWWFDFSSVTQAGDYYIYDPVNSVGSYKFTIADNVYNEVLKHAVRMLYYQRAGVAKEAQYAGVGWADAICYMKPGQDSEARVWNKTGDASTAKDVHGGWFDAGDEHRYTPYAMPYHIGLLCAYEENPQVWGDDYNIPESGNGIPDLLDEWKFSSDWALRLQLPDGGVISKVDVQQSCPPSAATLPSKYGSPCAISALRYASAMALGYTVIKQKGPAQWSDYANTLLVSAKKAWDWAVLNPDSAFDYHSLKLQPRKVLSQEEWVPAAVYLFEATGETKYRDYVDANYRQLPLFAWTNFIDLYRKELLYLLRYASMPNATPSVASAIRTAVNTAFNKPGDYGGKLKTGTSDPYRAFLSDYRWGSNGSKNEYGVNFQNMVYYDVESASQTLYYNASEDYIHYIHGVNPFAYVYITNMNQYGAENSVTEIWHHWFKNGTKWDKAGVSQYGPPPGYLTGGPNRTLNFNTTSCPDYATTGKCNGYPILPPLLQPHQKYFRDANSGMQNDWEITEPSIGYQMAYIRLLSKFAGPSALAQSNPGVTLFSVNNFYGRNVTLPEGTYTLADLTARGFYNNDASSIKVPAGFSVEMFDGDNLSGTKYTAESDIAALASVVFNNKLTSVRVVKTSTAVVPVIKDEFVKIFPNPTNSQVTVSVGNDSPATATLYSMHGQLLFVKSFKGSASFDLSQHGKGICLMKVQFGTNTSTHRVVVN